MEFIPSLKTTAQQIIGLSNHIKGHVRTWNEEKSAPEGGFTDRAGYVYHDDIELYVDAYLSEDKSKSLLRTRLAWVHTLDSKQEVFTIVTLDFNADPEKTKAIIDNSHNLSRQMISTLLTIPARCLASCTSA